MNEQIRYMLDNHDWKDSITKLLAYAKRLCELYRIKGIRLPSDRGFGDMVYDAIEKVYSWKRIWNPETDPDLHGYLISVVKSIIYNTAKSTDTRLRKSVEQKHYGNDLDESGEEEYIQNNFEYKELETAIAGALQGKPELCLVYKALKDGYKPLEIALEYALDIEVIRNAQKRLRRLVDKILEEIDGIK